MVNNERKQVIVYLADLRHNYQGVISTDAMPLGIGYMKAVIDKEVPNCYSELFAYPDELEKAINFKQPDILFLTNYMWNENLSKTFTKYAKAKNPNTLIVLGGPNIPIESERKIEYFKSLPYLDIYATGEGDFYASEIVKYFIEDNLIIKKLLKRNLHSSVYLHNESDVVITPIMSRSRNLDEIPSPWLTGVMDKFFDGKLAPLFETNRGCPFTCSFCVQGTKWYHRVNHFSLERIKEEIYYIGSRIKKLCPEQKMLRIADPNFGMYDRDIDISSYLGESQALFNWPLFIDATTGKNRASNIIKSMEKVNGALVMYQAVQSLDEDVLGNIKRKNIKLETYEEVQVYIRGRGLKSSSDLILGLPGETLESHVKSLVKLINSGTGKLNNFQSMMLKGSELETLELRDKYKFKTKFRLLPKNFGIYCNEKVFDIDEIIVETDTLPFDDYLKARQYHFIISLFWNESRFKRLVDFMVSLGFERWDFIEAIYQYLLKNKQSQIYKLNEEFLKETRSELFDDEVSLSKFFSDENCFDKVLKSEVGDNLMYKYRALSSFWYWEETCDFAFSAVKNEITKKAECFLKEELVVIYEEWKKFMVLNYSFGKNIDLLLTPRSEVFRYDIKKWIETLDLINISDYKLTSEQKLNFSVNHNNNSLLQGALKIWDYNLNSLPMLTKRIHLDWVERESVKEYS
jgi:radical SAM superfamily enzyme YgiQ (UPF0313 family)